MAAARLLLSLLSPNMQGARPFEKNEQYGRFSRTTVWAIAGAVVLGCSASYLSPPGVTRIKSPARIR